jgi:drug/metabolite transporter (DMT)-like permease
MNPLRGIFLKLCSLCAFMAMAACIKETAQEIPVGEAVFFRSVFAIPPLLLWLAWQRGFPGQLRTANPLGHLWRGLVGVSAMGMGFLALGLLPLPEAVAIGYAAPLLVTIFAAMLLGETIRAWRLSAVALGLAGVLVVLSPNLTALERGGDPTQAAGALAALMGAVFAALAQIHIRRLVATEPVAAIVFWFSVTSSVLALLTMPWGWVAPDRWQAALLILAGVLGGVGQILLTSSYRHAEAAVIASFEYASMLLALAVGYVLFDEIPTATMLAGAAIIVAAGLLIVFREHSLGLERGKARQAMTPQNR